MKLWYTSNFPFTSYTTLTPHSDSREEIFLLRDVTRSMSAHILLRVLSALPRFGLIIRALREVKACIAFMNDKRMSGSSLERKAFLRSPKTELQGFTSGQFAAQNPQALKLLFRSSS